MNYNTIAAIILALLAVYLLLELFMRVFCVVLWLNPPEIGDDEADYQPRKRPEDIAREVGP